MSERSKETEPPLHIFDVSSVEILCSFVRGKLKVLFFKGIPEPSVENLRQRLASLSDDFDTKDPSIRRFFEDTVAAFMSDLLDLSRHKVEVARSGIQDPTDAAFSIRLFPISEGEPKSGYQDGDSDRE